MPLHYRFLLAVGDGALTLASGSLVADRYWVWFSNIWLDTQPEISVVPLEILPRFVVPYLRLSAQLQHVPRPFTVLFPEAGAVPETVLLLDAAPIGSSITRNGEVEPFLLPSLIAAWIEGSALQQLNWLRQVAHLWAPLAQEGVAATLLQMEGLKVDHALLRLSQLTFDIRSEQPVTLVELGRRWQDLLPQAKPEIQPYLGWLVKALIQQDIASADVLVAELDQGIRTLAAGLSVAVDWVAYTDQGPERPRNEDACYPEAQLHQVQLVGQAGMEVPLLLVCDGIGGHEQGNVASQTAIEVLVEELQSLTGHPEPGPQVVEEHIYRALALANDAIADRNNDEQRSARARMGTTVVLALVHFPYVSIAHLGDSRAYRISDRTCYQITLDDDIASRESRLGYTLYQEAIQVSNGGALIQALGIGHSDQLYPTVQHLLLDDPTVLLLCSDGLCDYDRVEMLWRHHLLPLVLQQGDLQTTGQELIHQANQLNGHDNVTVGLLRLTPKPSTYSPLSAEAQHRSVLGSPSIADAQPSTRLVAPGGNLVQPEPAVAPTAKARLPWSLLLGGAVLVALGTGVASWIYQLRQPQATAMVSFPLPLSLVKVQANSLETMTWAVVETIQVGSFWQTGNATPLRRPQLLELSQSPASPGEADTTSEAEGAVSTPAAMSNELVPTGSILKVVSRQTAADQTTWVRLQICSIPSGVSLDQAPQENDGDAPSAVPPPDLSRRLSSPGQSGWVLESNLYRSATFLSRPTAIQRGTCSS